MYLNGACYIRVSTDDQTEFSPAAQLKLIQKYAKNNDIAILKEHIYIDEGLRGKRADKRPRFMQMIATAKVKPKPFDVILVHKFDRFARSREDSVVYKSLLRRECDIKVISITESIEDDKFAVILEAMLEAMAEYYSLNLAEEVKKGMTEKAERGGYQTTPPFGYTIDNNVLQPLPDEAEIVKFAYESYASREMNMRQLAQYINGLGIRTHRGSPFEPRTLEYILHNPVYIGKVRWTPTGKVRRDYNNPDTIIRDSEHEPLISVETWEMAQERNRENKDIYRKRERTTNEKRTWLSGLVKCAHCGKTIVVSGKRWMQCSGYVKATCNISAHTGITVLENLVLERVKETFEGKIEIEVVPKTSDNLNSDEYVMLNTNLERLEQREERIALAFQDGIDSLEEYKANKARIQKERDFVLEQLRALKEQLINPDNDVAKIETIASVYDLLVDANIDMETKYKTAHFLIEEITYSKRDKVLRITYR